MWVRDPPESGGQQQTSAQEDALLGPQSAQPGEVGAGLLMPARNHAGENPRC